MPEQRSSDPTRTIGSVNERHFAEVEKALLYVSEARERAERAAKLLSRQAAAPHLVEALEELERELNDLQRRVMQQTYFAVPKEQLTL